MALEYILAQKIGAKFSKTFSMFVFYLLLKLIKPKIKHLIWSFLQSFKNSEDSPYRGIPVYTFHPQISLSDITKNQRNFKANISKKLERQKRFVRIINSAVSLMDTALL